MDLEPQLLTHLRSGKQQGIEELGQGTVHGVAGIGNPARFFSTLRQSGLEVMEHPFPDHHMFAPEDLMFADDLPIIITEKDAIKCRGMGLSQISADVWVLSVSVHIPSILVTSILDKLELSLNT
jgi:tetraacyldisaccharide 4'-kinase